MGYHGQFPTPKIWPKHINKVGFRETTLNRVLHWMIVHHEDVNFIYSFKIGVEEFQLEPLPPSMGKRSYLTSLAVLQDCLYVFHISYPSNMDIWQMKNYGNVDSWTKESIILGSSIPIGLENDIFLPIMICRNREILIYVGSCNLISYSLLKKDQLKLGSSLILTSILL